MEKIHLPKHALLMESFPISHFFFFFLFEVQKKKEKKNPLGDLVIAATAGPKLILQTRAADDAASGYSYTVGVNCQSLETRAPWRLASPRFKLCK